MYAGVLLTGGIIRQFFPHILVMNMFSMMASTVILLEYLNPERFTDQSTGLFNEMGWREMMDELLVWKRRKSFWLGGFVIRDFNGLRDVYGSQQFMEGAWLIGSYILANDWDFDAFYVGEGRFVLIGSDEKKGEAALDGLKERFRHHWRGELADLILPISLVRLSPSCTSMDAVTAPGFMRYVFRIAAQPASGEGVIADADLLARFHRTIYVRKCLNQAIENNSIEMYLQPLVKAENGVLAGCEALARIRDTEGKLIYPDEFIPVAESNGMIEELGKQMFRKACAFMASDEVKNSSLQWINVNLSPLQCVDASLADTYMEIYRTYDLKPGSVYLEVTEQSLQDSSVLHKQIVRLQEEGIPFDLDDFGSMSSNLERLKDNPFIGVKLDKNMVWSYMDHPDFILLHIIEACHEMNIKVTAEGIENADMALVFNDLGCDYFQGYYYSKPVPKEEFLAKYCLKKV